MRAPPPILALLALLLATGCVNPFRPATPERPTSNSVVLENYDLPDSVLGTITRAFSAKGAGALAYQNALAAAFRATQPSDVEGLFTLVPAQWNLNYERNNLFPSISALRNDPYEMSFWRDNSLGADDDNQATDQVIYQRYYAVYAVDEVNATNDTIAFGIAQLTMQRFDTRWALTRWDDRYHPDLRPNTDPLSMGWRRLNSIAGTGN